MYQRWKMFLSLKTAEGPRAFVGLQPWYCTLEQEQHNSAAQHAQADTLSTAKAACFSGKGFFCTTLTKKPLNYVGKDWKRQQTRWIVKSRTNQIHVLHVLWVETPGTVLYGRPFLWFPWKQLLSYTFSTRNWSIPLGALKKANCLPIICAQCWHMTNWTQLC